MDALPKYRYIAFNWGIFLGVFGAHRFYLNQPVYGVLMLLTTGGFGIWWLIDMVRIMKGTMRDGQKQLLINPSEGEYPDFFERVAAFLYDISLVSCVVLLGLIAYGYIYWDELSVLFNTPIGSYYMSPEQRLEKLLAAVEPHEQKLEWISYGLTVLYFTLLTARSCLATPGKRMFGMVVVHELLDERVPVGPLRALWRSSVELVSYIYWLPFLVAAFNKKRKTLHDYAANTVVIRKEVYDG